MYSKLFKGPQTLQLRLVIAAINMSGGSGGGGEVGSTCAPSHTPVGIKLSHPTAGLMSSLTLFSCCPSVSSVTQV